MWYWQKKRKKQNWLDWNIAQSCAVVTVRWLLYSEVSSVRYHTVESVLHTWFKLQVLYKKKSPTNFKDFSSLWSRRFRTLHHVLPPVCLTLAWKPSLITKLGVRGGCTHEEGGPPKSSCKCRCDLTPQQHLYPSSSCEGPASHLLEKHHWRSVNSLLSPHCWAASPSDI